MQSYTFYSGQVGNLVTETAKQGTNTKNLLYCLLRTIKEIYLEYFCFFSFLISRLLYLPLQKHFSHNYQANHQLARYGEIYIEGRIQFPCVFSYNK